MDDLLQQGIAAYKAGKQDEAQKIFIDIVKQSPDRERAWEWLYNVCDKDNERIHCLKQILRLNPKNEKANGLLNKLLHPPLTSSIPPSASAPLSSNPIISSGNMTKKDGKPSRITIAVVASFAVVCCVAALAGVLSSFSLLPTNTDATPTEEAIPVEKIIAMTFSAAGSQTAVSYPTPLTTPTLAPTSTLTFTPTTMVTPTFPSETESPVVESDSWISHGLEGKTIYSLAIDPMTPTTLYAGIYGDGGGVFKTTDGGENWNAVNTGLTSVIINSLAIDPLTPSTLYAGTGNRGMFKSTDGGANWNTANTGLTNFTVAALAIDPTTPTTIYAGHLEAEYSKARTAARTGARPILV